MPKISIKLDSRGKGVLLIDGQPVPCKSLVLEADGSRPTLTVVMRPKDGVEVEADDAIVLERTP